MLRLLANQPISMLAFVVDDLLAPLVPPGLPGRLPCPGETFCKELLDSPGNLLPLVGADLVEDGPQGQTHNDLGDGVRSTPRLSPMLKCCSTPAVLQDHEVPHHQRLQGIQRPPSPGSYSALLHCCLPSLLIAALRAVIDGLGCWSVSGNLTSQGMRIHCKRLGQPLAMCLVD